MRLSDIVIVLSRPAEAGNVGAVCRAMKNMGLSRLRVTAPDFSLADANDGHKDAQDASAFSLSEAGLAYGGNEAVIRARAVHAFGVWEKAEFFGSLADAVKDCALVVGTTSRRGRYRKQVSMTPPELAAFLKDRSHSGQAALVFGNERAGLDEKEIELCNFASHIPVCQSFPSLNLSHAVQIYAYELFKALGNSGAVKGQWVPLEQESSEALAREITDNLKMLGFYKQAGREEQERFFRDIFSRAAVTEREGRYFADLIRRAARLAVKGGGE